MGGDFIENDEQEEQVICQMTDCIMDVEARKETKKETSEAKLFPASITEDAPAELTARSGYVLFWMGGNFIKNEEEQSSREDRAFWMGGEFIENDVLQNIQVLRQMADYILADVKAMRATKSETGEAKLFLTVAAEQSRTGLAAHQAGRTSPRNFALPLPVVAGGFRIILNDEDSILSMLKATSPQLVIFDGFNAEERFSHYVRAALPGAMRVLDMQDFHALRVGRERLVIGGASAAEVAAYRPEVTDEALLRELAAVHRCDATLAISEDERALLVDFYGVPTRKVHAAPFGHPVPPPLTEIPGWAERWGAMFIGNWRHRPNRDCARWLVQEVWPHVRSRLPDLELHIYGANQAPEDAALHDESAGVFVRGYCRCVPTAMRQHRLLVAPLRYGAGVKGKVTDAMCNGLVVVTTPVGIEGIAEAGKEFPGVVVADGAVDAEGFAAAAVSAYGDRAAWGSLQAGALGLVAERFDSAANGAQLRDFLARRWEALPSDRSADFVGHMMWHSSLRSTEWMAKCIAAKEELRRLERPTDAAS